MSDDNIVNFQDLVNRSKSDNAKSVEDRIVNCKTTEMKGGKCECMYCSYSTNAAKMMEEFLLRDMSTFMHNNPNASFATWDAKEILFKTIYNVIELEEEMMKEEAESKDGDNK